MKFVPTDNRILVRPLVDENVSPGGIVLPENRTKHLPVKGEIIACGPGRRRESGELAKMEFKVGQIIIFARFTGVEMRVDEEDLVLMREPDVLAIVEE